MCVCMHTHNAYLLTWILTLHIVMHMHKRRSESAQSVHGRPIAVACNFRAPKGRGDKFAKGRSSPKCHRRAGI